jgi:hypothetical protein
MKLKREKVNDFYYRVNKPRKKYAGYLVHGFRVFHSEQQFLNDLMVFCL